ncbi:MAG: tetratricopeptide repeat protein, partial [Candidatus Binatia bacterium]
FTRSGAALRAEIAVRADAMKKGPIGSRGTQLASLRLASSGRDLIDAGSLDGALEALERAVSLYGGNGYAYLYLAYVNHVQGRGEQAGEFAANARRYLPDDEAVLAELEGLALSIREDAATAGQ